MPWLVAHHRAPSPQILQSHSVATSKLFRLAYLLAAGKQGFREARTAEYAITQLRYYRSNDHNVYHGEQGHKNYHSSSYERLCSSEHPVPQSQQHDETVPKGKIFPHQKQSNVRTPPVYEVNMLKRNLPW